MYEIRYDEARGLLEYRLTGFWKMETVVRFIKDLRATVATIDRQPLHFDVLGDGRAFPVQGKEVSEALGFIMSNARRRRTGRTAVVVGSQVGRLQAERTLGGPELRVFLTMEEARAWLATPPEDAS